VTRADLRQICESLDPGGQTRLARLLDWHPSTVRRKLSGASKITKADELAIQAAICLLETQRLIRGGVQYRTFCTRFCTEAYSRGVAT
jgi:DNA-binding transcriptional regulator YdaS (Cro superfamily)